MRVLIVTNGHYDSILPLARQLDGLVDCTLNIQIEQDEFRQSIVDLPIKHPRYGANVSDDDTESIKAEVSRLLGSDIKLSFTKYPSRSFKDFRNWGVTAQWRSWARDQKFDLVHYNATSMLFFQQLLLTPVGPKVFSIHDHVSHVGEAAPQVRWLYRYMVARKRHRFIAHSDHVRQGFIEEYGLSPDRITTIPFGALDLYKKWEDPATKEDPNTILFFGRISPYKGLKYLAEAWQVIKETNRDARLIVAGSGTFNFDIMVLQSDTWVEIHNRHIDNSELVRFIQRAAVVVLPYIEATQSGVVMTAYAFNKPVVATNVGALPEVVEDGVTGKVVPPKDRRHLADALTELLAKPALREEMKVSISKRKSAEWSWEKIARDTVRVYEEALR
jgi:glycosyltransferase involved in cell wall biosynthesis